MKVRLTWGLAVAVAAFGADWTGFRGANGQGVQPAGRGLPVEFGPGRNVAWKASLPYGASSPVVAGGRVWVTASTADELLTISLDRETGREVWRRPLKRARKEQFHPDNDSASSTPVTDGQNVYVFFPELGLVSYGPDGNERWRHPLGPFDNMFGMAASPVLAEGLLVLVCDQQRGSFVMAVKPETGELAWRKDRPDAGIGWALPVVREGEVIVTGNRTVTGYRIADGTEQWRRRLVADASNGVPAIVGNTLYVNAAGYDQPWVPTWESAVARLNKDSDPRLTREELAADADMGSFFDYVDGDHDSFVTKEEWDIARMAGVGEYGLTSLNLGGRGEIGDAAVNWRMKRNLPYVPAPLLYNGVLYLAKNGGIVTTVDPKTGDILQQGRAPDAGGTYYASPVAGDGKVYLTSRDGRITVLRAARKWEAIATNDMGEECMASPAIDEDSLFVRTRWALYRFRSGGGR